MQQLLARYSFMDEAGTRLYAGESSRHDYPGITDDEAAELVEELASRIRRNSNFLGEDFLRFAPSTDYRVPWLRAWLGDAPVLFFVYRRGPDPDEVRRLFPESIVFVRKPEADQRELPLLQ